MGILNMKKSYELIKDYYFCLLKNASFNDTANSISFAAFCNNLFSINGVFSFLGDDDRRWRIIKTLLQWLTQYTPGNYII
jgi:hypothetical protein